MTPGQQTLLIAVDTLNEQDFTDLAFVTELNTRIQKRVFSARSRKPAPPPAPKSVLTTLRPFGPGTSDLIKKLAGVSPAPAPAEPKPVITTLQPHPVPKQVAQAGWPYPGAAPKQLNKTVELVLSKVSVGTIVKMKDTRDGHGFRLVTLFDLVGNKLDCVRLVEINAGDLAKHTSDKIFVINETGIPHLRYFRITNFPTTHGMAKVVAVVKPRGGLNNSHLVQYLPV